jgi:hypothetical protein
VREKRSRAPVADPWRGVSHLIYVSKKLLEIKGKREKAADQFADTILKLSRALSQQS